MISILIIGNEVLSAQVQETNLKHMLAQFGKAGYRVDEARIVRDDIPVIAQAIRELSAKSRFLISTGGVGPTHDDVTYEAYAAAFQSPLYHHPEIMKKVYAYFGDNVKDTTKRIAYVPKITELIYSNENESWPLTKISNCFVLPGLPEVFLQKFASLMAWLPQAPELYFADIYTKSREVDFASQLSEVQAQFSEVEIGSYPTYDRSVYAARLTFKAGEIQSLTAAFEQMVAHFTDMNTLVRFNEPHHANDE